MIHCAFFLCASAFSLPAPAFSAPGSFFALQAVSVFLEQRHHHLITAVPGICTQTIGYN